MSGRVFNSAWLLAVLLAVGSCSLIPRGWFAANRHSGFVTVEDSRFCLDQAPYRFVGSNLWYGAYIAAPGKTGDMERLRRELDVLKALGVTNLRILGASEESPMKNSLKPAFHDTEGRMNEDLLTGLDRLLDEMAKRDMKAVIYLNNFWEWSGGMGTYLSWVNGGHYVDLGDPDHPWPEFPLFNMRFYENDAANEIYIDYVRALVVRVNSVNGRAYRDDPTIMAWQLANEPRPGYSTEPGLAVLEAYYKWIEDTSSFIKSLDPNHLVSTGSEGVVGCADNAACYIEAHNAPAIDYLTFHMWPKNWSWINGDDVQGSLGNVEGRAMEYMASHISMAERLNKPLVLEEFGFPRDDGALQVASSVDARDGFFRIIFRELERDVALGGPFSGTNFWTWGGEGRAEHADFLWQMEDVSYTGDPPQEPQGLNSVFDRDRTTLALLKQHGRELNRLGKNQSACGQRE